MKKVLLFVVSIAVTAAFSFVSPAFAADTANGAKLFASNCGACHAGGGNVVLSVKNLSADAMEKYLVGYSEDHEGSIAYQIAHGKGSMPAFGRLKEEQINDIAAYVEEKAQTGW
ncbi:MAG: c-type cytochrome [Prochloraceae cyanobacterium]|nr:c-type cytochrome [Prochloraceae cyanobacterium]